MIAAYLLNLDRRVLFSERSILELPHFRYGLLSEGRAERRAFFVLLGYLILCDTFEVRPIALLPVF